jgi:hypothetical protein
MELTFGDNVRVLESPDTKALGVAGLKGQVHGLTTPSQIHVEVIGSCEHDHAVNVFFESLKRDMWLIPELLEFLDHAPGTTVRVGSHAAVRNANGDWEEAPPEKGQPRRSGFARWFSRIFR